MALPASKSFRILQPYSQMAVLLHETRFHIPKSMLHDVLSLGKVSKNFSSLFIFHQMGWLWSCTICPRHLPMFNDHFKTQWMRESPFPFWKCKELFFFERLIFCFNCSMNNLFTSPISTYNVSNDQCEYIFLHLGGNGWWWFMIIIPECTLIFIHSHLSSHTHHRPLYQLLPHLHADGKRSKLSLQKLLPRVGFVIFLC